MEFPEDYKPSTIFFDLFFEVFKFGLSESKPITISLEKSLSVVTSEEVSESIPHDRSDNREQNQRQEIIFSEKSSNKEHNLLSRYKHADNRE